MLESDENRRERTRRVALKWDLVFCVYGTHPIIQEGEVHNAGEFVGITSIMDPFPFRYSDKRNK
jgi:hypothetical protein